MASAQGGEELNAQEAQPDAMGQGWVTPPGGERVDALFVLAGTSLGIGRTERIAAPVWLALSDLVSLDAIGEPADGLTEVEIGMADGTVIGAGWTDEFCSAVVECLRSGAESRSEIAVGTDLPASTDPVAPVQDPAVAGVSTASTESSPFVVSPAPTPTPEYVARHEPDADIAAAPGAPDVRFDEIVAGERHTSPVAPLGAVSETGSSPFGPTPSGPTAPGPTAPGPTAADLTAVDPIATGGESDAVVFSAQPVVRNRSRGADSNGSFLTVPQAPTGIDLVPAEEATPVGDPVEPPVATPPVEPIDRSGALELEDVVYLGGYPGQTRRRKKCTAVLTHAGLEVAGPGDLRFRIAWDVVKTVEAQNSDEARFRMNTKIHGNSSALVIECDQGVTILLEARDCPTIPLRSAIAQLLADLPVLVV